MAAALITRLPRPIALTEEYVVMPPRCRIDWPQLAEIASASPMNTMASRLRTTEVPRTLWCSRTSNSRGRIRSDREMRTPKASWSAGKSDDPRMANWNGVRNMYAMTSRSTARSAGITLAPIATEMIAMSAPAARTTVELVERPCASNAVNPIVPSSPTSTRAPIPAEDERLGISAWPIIKIVPSRDAPGSSGTRSDHA